MLTNVPTPALTLAPQPVIQPAALDPHTAYVWQRMGAAFQKMYARAVALVADEKWYNERQMQIHENWMQYGDADEACRCDDCNHVERDADYLSDLQNAHRFLNYLQARVAAMAAAQ